MKLNRVLLPVALLIFVATSSFSQITTATIFGTITDDSGEPLIAATVVAEHLPSGTLYGTTTQDNGRYNLPNLRIGGPYEVRASYLGYSDESVGDISLGIGQKELVNLTLIEQSTTLEEVIVSANANSIINNERTGAATMIDDAALRKLPTISRNTSDFYRLTPSASGNSFLGRNDQFNNFSLDGSIFNNPFGLDAATPGGQTEAAPIPLDAIEEVSVALSPFDVTQAGFTGASVNTVTKSGTNDFRGTAFVVWRNQDLTGGKIEGEDIFVPDLTQLQTGISIGGPIIKDKFFFNASFELQRRDDLGANFLPDRGQGGNNVSRVTASDFERVRNALLGIGYDPGAYEGFLHATDNQKGLIKLDYNVNENHKLTFKYNFLDASKDKPAHPSAIGRRGPDATTLQFQNSGYTINNIIHSGILEWKSLYGNKFSNKLQAGYTYFDDSRDVPSDPFPVVNINKNGIRYIVAGHEPFSVHNRLDQGVLQLTNNFNYFAGDHTFTIGASLERFDFDNSFNLGVYEPFEIPGVTPPYGGNTDYYPGGTFGPGFESVDAFVDFVESGQMAVIAGYSQGVFDGNGGDDGTEGEGWALAETNVGQFAVYLQDEWQVNDQFRLTGGIRMDVPLYFDTKTKIEENLERQCCYNPSIEYFDEDGNTVFFDHTVLPEQKPLFSPRLGFNYDLQGDKTQQLRGGTGFFTGRFPFVWVGNQVANPNDFFYTMTRSDFKFPQTWKTNFGYDQDFGNGFIATVDLIYMKDINSMMVRNYGLNMPTGTLGGVDNRPVYDPVTDRNSAGNNAYVFTNSDKGNSFNFSLELKKDWGDNFFTGLSYNFNDTEDVSSIEAEISGDAYDRNPAFGNVNQDVLAASIYGNRHRIVGHGFKTFEYGNGRLATTIAAFLEMAQGGRFSYTYSGDLNGDGSFLNDLIYIPTSADIGNMMFANPGEGSALEDFIEQDEYLSDRRGEYAEKYAILSPWYSSLDLRILQDINFNDQTVQISLDILNAMNLINSDWGVRQFPTNTQPIGIAGFDDGEPIYTFDESLEETFTVDPGLLSRWQVQLGLRYIF